MKTFIYRITLLFAGVALLAACNDKTNNPEPQLTNCTGCQFLFTENAELVIPGYNFTSGDYRIFWSETKKNVITQRLYIKAPMQGTSFNLTKADIVAGKIIVLDNCPNCNLFAMQPVDGTVKGVNTTPGARADKAKWLIEAKIIREPVEVNNSNFRDTVYVKQYFGANFVID